MAYASAVVVSITPKQPSFFAGETFECTITFTNTHPPIRAAEHRRSLSASPQMRRVASDVGSMHASSSSAITITPASPVETWPSSGTEPPSRLGLLGPRTQHERAGTPSRRRTTFASRREAPRPERGAKAVPSSHPHARQKSVVAYQVEDLSQAFGLLQAQERPIPKEIPTSPYPDPYATHNKVMDAALRESVASWANDAQLLEHTSQSPLFPSRDTLPPGHEKLLWAFAQIGGTMEVERGIVRPADFDQLRMRLARGEMPSPMTTASPSPSPSPAQSPATPRTLGGGELGYDAEYEAGTIDIETGAPTATATHDLRASHVPAISTIAALLFRPMQPTRSPHTPRHWRTGSTLSDIQTRALLSPTLPTYSAPPTMLDVDVELAPGESRSYTFSLRLPADLPPSFHGHAVHFDYYLTIGTNRVDPRVRGMQESRLLHIPIRVYNHVVPGAGPLACFDLLNPVVASQSEGHVEVQSAVSAKQPDADDHEERTRLSSWAQELVHGHVHAHRTDTAAPLSSMDAINDLAQRASKVTYDIAKDGHVAALLTLARAKYKVGDSVQVLLRMNEPGATVRIVRVAASLESHEEVDASMALLPPGRTQTMTRQVYATQHEATLDTRQTCLWLPIPSGATPEFSTSGIRHRWSVRISLLTQMADDGTSKVAPPPHLMSDTQAFAAFQTSLHDVPVLCGRQGTTTSRLEIVECSVPVMVLPHRSQRKTDPVLLYA